jgi:hypothetical protein
MLVLKDNSTAGENALRPQGSQIISGKEHQVSTIIIEALPEVVWQVISDYERVVERFPFIKRSRIAHNGASRKVFEQEVQPLPPIPATPYTVEVIEQRPNLLEWRGLTSYIRVNQGFFNLELVDELRTSVFYAMCIEGVFCIPHVLIRHQLNVIMPQILQIIKVNAEAP